MTPAVLGKSEASVAPPSGSGDSAARALLSSSAIAAICVSPHGQILAASPALLKLLRLNSTQALRARDFCSEVLADAADWQHWQRAIATRRVAEQSLVLRSADGREIFLKGDIWAFSKTSGGIDYLLGVFADVTKAHQVDEALQHAAKAEAMSSLTSGIIHDFNNLLTVLVGNLYLVAEGVRDNPKLFEQAKRARDVAKRGTELIRQLLAFSRQDCAGVKTLNTWQLISNLKPVLDHALGSRITLHLAVPPDLACIDASAALLESVIVNLVVNARDAIETDGTITISGENRQLADKAARQLGVAPGSYVAIAVSDNGCGIPESLQARVFEAFFSTKGKHRGTGLGLSMVRRFAEELGGAVALASQPGKGTRVTLLLPGSRGTPEDSALLTMPVKMLPSGHERVLVFAEDAALSKTVAESLSILGYAAQVTGDATEFVRLASIKAAELLVIDSSAGSESDLRLLGARITGDDWPAAVLITGDSETRWQRIPDSVAKLRKPFSLRDLATSVRDTLDRRHRE